ncbi:hypothetical protein KKF69_06055 [Patescibacteria group bacterium]|nr:hypothetical protein [Patescibacteria group bacterium]
MTDLQTIFYIVGIMYMVLSTVVLIAIIAGIFIIFRTVRDIRRKVEEKIKNVERIIQHPEEIVGAIGASLIQKGLQKVQQIIRRKKASN